MKKLITALLATLLLAGHQSGALAADAKDSGGKAPTPQQQKMKSCNAEAKQKALKGPERKAFMKSCLSGDKK